MRQTISARVMAFAAFAFAATAVFAQTPASSQSNSTSVAEQVKSAEQQLLASAIKGEKDDVARLVGDNVTWVGADGKVLGKDAMLAMLPAPVESIGDQQVRSFGNTAIVTGSVRMKDGHDGRYLNEWVRRDGEWKLMAHEGFVPMTGTQASGTGSGTPAATGTAGKEPSERSTASSVATTLNTADERAVWQAMQALSAAFERGDAEAYSKYTSSDYVRMTPDGKVQGKNEFVQSVKENASKSRGDLEQSDVQVIVDGDSARVIEKTWGTLPGGQQVPPVRATRIFEKRDGRWQQVAAIFTPVKSSE